MKSRKVLLGLFLGIVMCCAGTVTAQTKANYQNNLTEIGPDNIGGRVRAMVADRTHNNDLYAGTATGGLFTKSSSASNWDYVPYYKDNKEITLPISFMVQHPVENTIFIATGESYYQKGINTDAFAPMGRGIFRFNPSDKSFTVIPTTVPANLNSEWASINRVACMENSGKLYFYAATPAGLYRWVITSEADWNAAPTKVFNGPVDDIEMVSTRNIALFTSGNQVYRIGNVVNNSTPQNISSTNSAFGGTNTRVELAVAPNNGDYVYALVFDENYLMQALYLCTDQQNWVRLTTSTITPFNAYSKGTTCGALAVDPNNPGRVFLGGATLWVGQGYTAGSYYQWNKTSYAEYELNGGDYMSQVYSIPLFVHSGINYILCADGEWGTTAYMATDGGIYSSHTNSMEMFVNQNRGLNNVQVNSIDVCPDGSVIAGAYDNSCPFIESRMAHNAGDVNSTWYDNSTTMNHMANILWKGNGGQVAASMFQQVQPLSRRGIIVSSEGGAYGRSFGDYNNYTNTQTWTAGADFIDNITTGPAYPQVALWETDTNTMINDSLYIKIDSNNVIYTANGRHKLHKGDTIHVGDTLMVPSPAHFYYPYEHIFTKQMILTEEVSHIRVSNPLITRLFLVGKSGVMNYVYMNWYPMDFRRICTSGEDDLNKRMNWPALYSVTGAGKMIHAIAPSRDGNVLFVTVLDTANQTSTLVRVRGLNTVNYCTDTLEINKQLDEGNRSTRVYTYDTIEFNGSKVIDRMVSAISVDQRNGKDNVIVTFDGYSDNMPGVLYLSDATADNYTATDITPNGFHGPVYSSMTEYTTGDIYIGTEDGVFTSSNKTTWNEYGAFCGVPVTSMKQQIRNLQVKRNTIYTGINEENYLFAKTKYPYAMYFGTYGRGIFMDMQYVTDTVNEILDEQGLLDVPTVRTIGANSVSVYPNPAFGEANLDITIHQAGNATVKVYDLSGRQVSNLNLGKLQEGSYTYKLDCQNYKSGMYLVNIVVGNQSAATKLVVR